MSGFSDVALLRDVGNSELFKTSTRETCWVCIGSHVDGKDGAQIPWSSCPASAEAEYACGDHG